MKVLQWLGCQGDHLDEWVIKTMTFVDCAFSLSMINKVWCPCSRCQNMRCLYMTIVFMHLCQHGFMSHYELWRFLRESATQTIEEEKEALQENDKSTRARITSYRSWRASLVGQGRCPAQARTRPFFAGSSSSGSRRSQLLSHVEAEGSCQQRRPVSEVLHNIIIYIYCYTDSISYDLYNFIG
jgi:hypothetical protein